MMCSINNNYYIGKETKKPEAKTEVKQEKEVSVEIKTINLKQMPTVILEDNSNAIT